MLNCSTTIRTISAALIALLSTAGCAHTPVYETTYSYAPPQEETGRTCAMQCEVSRSQCDQLATERAQSCQTAATQEFDHCNAQADSDLRACQAVPGRVCMRRACVRRVCGDSNDCADTYNRCYSTCGGTVTPNRQCVRHCGS